MPSDPFNMTKLNLPTYRIPAVRAPADHAQEGIAKRIRSFESRLGPDEEMGVLISGSISFRIARLGYYGALVIFYGEDAEGRAIETYQHHTQTNLTLIAMAKPEGIEARRIGFDIGVFEKE